MYLVLKMFLFLLENENFKIIHFIGKKKLFYSTIGETGCWSTSKKTSVQNTMYAGDQQL